MARKFQLTDDQWRERLTAEQYQVLRQKGTERAFCGAFWNHKESGSYHCAGCDAPLFETGEKFNSGTGWPSFTAAIDGKSIEEIEDHSHGMHRIEVVCNNCGSHLGHVFPDGPPYLSSILYQLVEPQIPPDLTPSLYLGVRVMTSRSPNLTG